MEKIIGYLSKNLVSTLIVGTLSGLTIFTSAAGAIKVASNLKTKNLEVPEVKAVSEEKKEKEDTELTQNPTPTKKSSIPVTGLDNPFPKASISTNPLQSTSTSTNTNKCIITLFGNSYDVTSLKSTHSGGDVFTCGTDMTASYQNQHGTNLSRMQPYLVSNSQNAQGNSQNTNTTSTGINSASSAKVRYDDDLEEDEDEKHEDKGDDKSQKNSDDRTEISED